MYKKLLTIVIPTYNMQDYLNRCLDSLIVSECLMFQLEVLVVIDGSKDRSSEIAHTYQDRYPETFRVIDKENGNYGSCVNRGLKEAAGKYIKVLDADDWFDNKNFEEFLTFLSVIDVDLIISDFVEVNDNGEVQKSYIYRLPQTATRLSQHPQCNDMWMHAVTYKTENLRKIKYFQTEGISYTDQEWIFLPMTTVSSMVGFPKVVYHYLVGRSGQTVDVKVKSRSIRQEITSWETMQLEYEQLAEMGDAQDYLWFRLSGRASYIYRFIIFGMGKQGTTALKELDDFIAKHNPKLYQELGQLSPRADMHLKFIALWRSHHYNSGYVNLLWKIEKAVLKIKRNKCKSK